MDMMHPNNMPAVVSPVANQAPVMTQAYSYPYANAKPNMPPVVAPIAAPTPCRYNEAAAILVLFILLVIIARYKPFLGGGKC